MEVPRLTICVVEDDDATRATLVDLLHSKGYATIEAAEAGVAVEMAASTTVDAFLLDIRLNGMDGIELCRRIRSMAQYRLTPVLFVTAAGEENTLTSAFEAGGDDFVSKPFNPVILQARLRGQLQRTESLRELERVRLNLNRFVSNRTQEVAETLARTGHLPRPEERELAICFTDIRGFTALSEELEPAELFAKLNDHLADQVNSVYSHGGYIDKFGGDGVMAVFDGTEMAIESCRCALHIIELSMQDLEHNGIKNLGIGIHMGRAIIGNIGSAEHLDYSVIGSTVNLAARLCGEAKPMSIVVSRAVRDAAGNAPDLRFTDEREVRVRGLKQPVTVYTLSRAS